MNPECFNFVVDIQVDHGSDLHVHDVLKLSLASKGQQMMVSAAKRVKPLNDRPV